VLQLSCQCQESQAALAQHLLKSAFIELSAAGSRAHNITLGIACISSAHHPRQAEIFPFYFFSKNPSDMMTIL
jgi:hypothetical protein